MARYFQYWIGAAVIATLTMAAPLWLITDGKHLEASVIAIPSLAMLAWGILATIGMLRKE
jgi:multisubunit Na+/H+ antiporter MnhF subunit